MVKESTLAAAVLGVAFVGFQLRDTGRSVTVYPMMECPQGCDYVSGGHTWKRQQLDLGKETYTAIPETQEVVSQSGPMIHALTREGYQCAVADGRNWSCSRGERGSTLPDEILMMVDGGLSYTDTRPQVSVGPVDQSKRLFYTSYCYSWQVSIHNNRIHGNELPTATPSKTPNSAVVMLQAGIFGLTGCVL